MNRLTQGILVVVFITICGTCVALKIQNNRLIKYNDYLELVSEAKDMHLTSLIENRIKAIYQYNFYKLPSSDSVYSFDLQKKISPASLTENGPTLILRLLESDCPPCVDSTLYSLAKQCNDLDKTKVAILTDKAVPRDIIVFARSHNILFSIYKVDRNELSIPLEEETPYFFMLDDNLNVYDPFVVKRDYMSHTNSYLKWMTEKLL